MNYKNMPLTLHNLKPAAGSKKKKKRVGRGNASGHGTYSCRGGKGQRARSGGKKGLQLMGFRSQLLKIPKMRGFRSMYPKMETVNISDLEKIFASGETVTPEILSGKGLVKNIRLGVKILNKGELTKKLIVKNCFYSKAVEDSIKKAGGEIIEKHITHNT